MDLQLHGRTALVTGASQGIGLATAELLAAEGARVMLCARGEEQLAEAAAQIGGEHEHVAADVAQPGEAERAVAHTVERFGAIDILVNNAGGITSFGGYDDLEDADWQEAFDLNVMSVLRAAQAALPHMRARDWGRIVNVASESAIQPDAFFPHYAAAKSAVLSITKSLSKATAGTEIRVNVVSPAFVKTPILERMLEERAEQDGVALEEAERRFLAEQRPNITAGRAGRPEEVARMIAFLASDAASFVNGANLRVDCGSVSAII